MSSIPKSLTDTVYAVIEDRFEKGDAGELLLTCPFDEDKSYDIYDDLSGRYEIIIDDSRKLDRDHKTIDAAKRRVAELIAERLLASQKMIKDANALGIRV